MGLTQAKLAERSGTDKAYISKVETISRTFVFQPLKNDQRRLGARLEISIKL
jgi:transcriptional regulator with XRE-family HTH domain